MIYRLITLLLWPVLLIYTIRISIRDRDRRYLLQRLGFGYGKSHDNYIWIHCASVGEVNTYLPLHHQLLTLLPDSHFIISTNTTTGASTVLRQDLQRTEHRYLPVESASAISRFLESVNIQQCLIMETEIWPLLYQQCSNRNISISIINARLSHRTLNANRFIKSIYKHSLTQVDKILCKSEKELNNFRQLGAENSRLAVAGNLKFAYSNNDDNISAISLNNIPYWLAASTHNDEEFQLAQLWQKIDEKLLLVIVPRHPNRSEQIQKQLRNLAIPFAVRSKQQTINKETRIYLADTLGELKQFMLGAEFVFIGGSLIKHGGQNILEAARMKKASICGPHMYNFTDELELLIKSEGCIQIQNIEQLKATIMMFLEKPEITDRLGSNALQAVQQQGNVINNYIELLTLKELN